MTNLMGKPPLGQKAQSKPQKTSKPMRRVSAKKASEDRPLRKSARGEACTLRIPGVCDGGTETTVLCHVSTPGGSGMGTKPIDMHGLYGCADCHRVLDDRASWDCYELSWHHVLLAVFETQRRMIEKGLVFLK